MCGRTIHRSSRGGADPGRTVRPGALGGPRPKPGDGLRAGPSTPHRHPPAPPVRGKRPRAGQAHREIVEDFARGRHRSLEADWLTDNFHIIEDTLREVEHDLPGGYYSELPKLAAGPLAGYPRVFALALALVAHSDSGLDEARITRYVQAFQTIAPLTIGELWAVPTMLRLVRSRTFGESLIRCRGAGTSTGRPTSGRSGILPAGAGVADRGAEEGGSPSAPPVSLPRLTDAFVVRLIQVLRDQGPKAATVLSEIESRLTERHLDANEVLRREHRRQAAGQVSLGNCVTSLRLLSALDWNIFFERNSLVEAILRDDPGRVYARQEFATRDHYRRVVEKIARGSDSDELDVARVRSRAGEGRPRGRRSEGPRRLLPHRCGPVRAQGGIRLPSQVG